MSVIIAPNIDYTNLDDLSLNDVVSLIRNTIPDYYDIILEELDGKFEIFKSLLSDKKSDLSYPIAAIDSSNRIIGLIKTQLLPDEKNNSLYTLMSFLNTIDKLKWQKILTVLEKRPQPPPVYDQTVYLSFISISKVFQGKGVAQLLLDHIIECDSKVGMNQISLHVSVYNERAINFYLKNQFVIRDKNAHYLELVRKIN